MPIEVWGSDEAGHLMLMPDPSPERTPTPPGEPPLAQDPSPPREAAPPPEPTHADELKALRTMIEQRDSERAAREAQRDGQLEQVTKLLRGEDLTPPKDATPAEPVRPKAEDFQSHEEYVEAVADFKASEKVAAFRQEQQQERQQTQQREQLLSRDQAVKAQEERFVADHPDYVDVVTKGLATTPPEFRQLIMLVDDAPAVAYQVAQDPELRQRLLAMPPGPLFYALGRLSASAGGGVSAPAQAETIPPPGGGDTRTTLGTGGAPPSRGSTPAPSPAGRPKPAPPRPLGGSGAGVPGGYSDDMSIQDYKKWRKAMAG